MSKVFDKLFSAHKMCKLDPVDSAPSHFHGKWNPALPSMSVLFVVAASALMLVLAMSSRSVVFDFALKHFDLSQSTVCCVEKPFQEQSVLPSCDGDGDETLQGPQWSCFQAAAAWGTSSVHWFQVLQGFVMVLVSGVFVGSLVFSLLESLDG